MLVIRIGDRAEIAAHPRRRSNNVPTKFLQYVVDASGRHTLELDWWTKGEDYTYITW
jgi:hypothetical protein